jgi:hypothetical protein
MLLSTLTDPLYSTELRRAFARLCTISGDLDYKAVRVRAVWTFRVADEILSPAKLEAKWEIRLTVDADRHTIEQRCLVNADFAEWVDYDISYNSSFVIFSECWEPGDKAVSIQDLHRHFDSFLRTSRPVEQRPRFSSIRIEVPIRSDLLGLLLTHVLVQSTSVIRSLHFKYATPLPLFRLKGILRVLLYLEGLYALGEEPQLGRASDFEPWSLLRDLDKLAEFVQDWSYTGKGPLQALTIPIDCTPPDSESVSLPRPTNFSWQGSAGPLETLIFGLFSRSGPVWPRPILDLSRCLPRALQIALLSTCGTGGCGHTLLPLVPRRRGRR